MDRHEPFAVGMPIVWRSRPNGDVGYVFGCRVLLDSPEVAAVVQPTGSPIVRRRIAGRGGPSGRSYLPGTWDGSRRESQWDRPPCVRLQPIGRRYSVIRTWLVEEERFDGWYVNLEQPWRRVEVGFDSRDDILDVTVSRDLRTWELKDVDDLQFAVGVGQFTSREADSIHATAESVIDDLGCRRPPFDEATWSNALPLHLLEPTRLPDGWEAT